MAGSGPAAPGAPWAPDAPSDAGRPAAAERSGSALDVRDVVHLIPAAQAARDALAASDSGRPLSRDRLADRMREDGHAVSNVRAGLLVRVLKAEAHVTPIDRAAASTVDSQDDQSYLAG